MDLNSLLEALKPSQYRQYVKGWDKTRYEEIFRKYTTDKKAYRIYIPIVHDNGDEAKKVEAPPDIIEAVALAGYVIEDYVTGIAASADGKRKIKIGKILARSAPELAQKFANDKKRQASREAEWFCVISRHPYDIAGMSTDRGWTSCMNIGNGRGGRDQRGNVGSNRHYVPIDIKEGTIVAYLVRNEDKNINNPAARMLIKPFIDIADKTTIAFGVENKVYGQPVAGFEDTVVNWCNEQNAKKKLEGLFELPGNLYNDGYEGREKSIGDPEVGKQESLLRRYPDRIANIENPTERQMLIVVNKEYDAIRLIKEPTDKVMNVAIKNSYHSIRYMGHVWDRVTDEMKMMTINDSRGSMIPHLMRLERAHAKKDLGEEFLIKAVSLGNVYGSVKMELGHEPSEAVQEAAVRHYARSIESIENPSDKIRMLALETDGSLIERLDKPSEEEQLAAAKSYKYLLKYLLKKKIKWSSEVIREALKHFPAQIRYVEKAPAELLKHAIAHDGHAIEYMLHLSHISPDLKNSLMLDAVKQNGFAIKHFEKPSKQLQVAAVKTTPEAIKLIHNPHPAAVKIAKEAGVSTDTKSSDDW